MSTYRLRQSDVLERAKRGERVKTDSSMHEAEKDVGEHGHYWRTIYCDGDTDIVECSDCGMQRIAPCSFDDDYS